jgi:uncharacterized membrane protein
MYLICLVIGLVVGFAVVLLVYECRRAVRWETDRESEMHDFFWEESERDE